MRNFGLTRGVAPGEQPRPLSLLRADTPREYINRYFPSGSIWAEPADAPLPRSNLAQAMLDILALSACAFLICLLAASIGVALYIVLHFFVGV